MKEFNVFKMEYSWYEGEHEETWLGKVVDEKEFEQDLCKAKDFAENLMGKTIKGEYLGKGYSVECLPEYYHQIIWYLMHKANYVSCEVGEEVSYDIDDDAHGNKITITRCEKQIQRQEIKGKK